MLKFIDTKAAKAATISTASKFIAVFFLCGIGVDSLAQATVRDSSPISSSPTVTANTPTAVQSPAADYGLISQIQQLQQEVSELRGLVEEQSFEIKRLKQQRLDDYLDLDKRVSELSKQGGQSNNPAPSVSNNSNAGALAALSNNSLPTGASAEDTAEAEKKLYRKAIDQLLSQQDYAGAQTSFNQYLAKYPSGTYSPNVHYWQGQIYLTDSDKKSAETSFTTLLNDYPDHQKAPDAKYKLATIYYDQGKKAEAKKMLDEVVASNSDASRLAKSFLANQYK